MAEHEWPEDMPRMGQLMEEASVWFARMRGPDAESYRPDFEHWLALGAAHRGAYNRAGEIFAMGRFLAAEKAEAQSPANDDEPARWRWAAIAAGAALVVSVTGWIVFQQRATVFGPPVQIAETSPTRASNAPQRYTTVAGERRSIKLTDGSVVELDAASELTEHFDPSTRELRLVRGRARFDVAHENRPFMVLAGGGSVTARGTLFDVIMGENKQVTVRLLRGAVDVERPRIGKSSSETTAIARLEPGETLSFASFSPVAIDKSSSSSQLHSLAPVPALSPVREFDRALLSTVVAEANKGSATAIRLSDPSIGTLKVSGRFRIDDADQVAERLAALFDLEAERTQTGEITLRRR